MQTRRKDSLSKNSTGSMRYPLWKETNNDPYLTPYTEANSNRARGRNVEHKSIRCQMKKKRSSHDLGLGMDFFNWNVIALQCGVSFSMQRSDSAICTHVSPPSGTSSLPHPTHPGHREHGLGPLCIPPTQVTASMGWALCAFHPPRSSRPGLGPLCCTAASRQLFYM